MDEQNHSNLCLETANLESRSWTSSKIGSLIGLLGRGTACLVSSNLASIEKALLDSEQTLSTATVFLPFARYFTLNISFCTQV